MQSIVTPSISKTVQVADKPPLVLHLIFRLAMGGLENGLVNVVNHMPVSRYRHAIVCLTDFTDFRDRITRDDVEVVAIHKKRGMDWGAYARVWKMIKQFKPQILHTRNLPTMEYAILAAFAGVPYRLHGEHGRDVHDQYGASRKFQLFRKVVAWWIHHFITVSEDLASWFQRTIGIESNCISQIYNGVDVDRFHPRQGSRSEVLPKDFSSLDLFLVGTVGRLQTVKDQVTLVRAFVHFRNMVPDLADRARLVVVGEGPLRSEIEGIVRDEGLDAYVWITGERQDIPDLLRSFDLFVLPSEAEGISNTILEAMASGLPIVATAVGGNCELVKNGETGYLVPPKDPAAMADKIAVYGRDKTLVARHGEAGRALSERRFSLEAMVNQYLAVYDSLLGISRENAQMYHTSLESSRIQHYVKKESRV